MALRIFRMSFILTAVALVGGFVHGYATSGPQAGHSALFTLAILGILEVSHRHRPAGRRPADVQALRHETFTAWFDETTAVPIERNERVAGDIWQLWHAQQEGSGLPRR